VFPRFGKNKKHSPVGGHLPAVHQTPLPRLRVGGDLGLDPVKARVQFEEGRLRVREGRKHEKKEQEAEIFPIHRRLRGVENGENGVRISERLEKRKRPEILFHFPNGLPRA
jgi:hypothetical protein